MIKEKIAQKADELWPQVVQNRRTLHAHPELSFKEFKTADFIKSVLDELGIPWQSMANTGVVAILKGGKPSDKCLALRADIDALPIVENNDLEFKSCYPGVMHACGHDAHTASLLGVLKILQSLQPEFGGTIKFIFQPGEEMLPGGASIMIKEGVLDNPKPQCMIGMHVMPSIPCGDMAIRKGKFMASMDELTLNIKGKGGHGAQPHLNIDPVMITAHILVALQQIVSRMSHPGQPTVLSFGKIIANGAFNIIPDEVFVQGTFRTMDEQWRQQAHEKMIHMAEHIALSMGGTCEFTINKGYPYLINNESLSSQIQTIAEEYLGSEHVLDQDIWMAAEDFAYYSQVTDACFYLLGVGNPQKGYTSALHTPDFKIEEEALKVSTGLMAYIAVRMLE